MVLIKRAQSYQPFSIFETRFLGKGFRMIKEFILVFVGGGLGSTLRYALAKFFKAGAVTFSWPTLSANLIACLLLGTFTGFLMLHRQLKGWESPLLLAGFCGGLSTFSTLVAELVGLFDDGQYSKALLVLMVSLLLGSGLFLLGLKSGQWLCKSWT